MFFRRMLDRIEAKHNEQPLVYWQNSCGRAPNPTNHHVWGIYHTKLPPFFLTSTLATSNESQVAARLRFLHSTDLLTRTLSFPGRYKDLVEPANTSYMYHPESFISAETLKSWILLCGGCNMLIFVVLMGNLESVAILHTCIPSKQGAL